MAQQKRVVSSNMNNLQSSRSHLIVDIILENIDLEEPGQNFSSKLRFVDLAGSEKALLESKYTLREGSNINKSLLSLTNCINILSDNSQKQQKNGKFIPYRNSKLTRLLKDSLGGSNPISMIVCLSPNSIYLDESLNSIKYAQKAKMINTPVQRDRNWSNVPVYKEENYQKRIEQLEKECKCLQSALRTRKSTSLIVEKSLNLEQLIKQSTSDSIDLTQDPDTAFNHIPSRIQDFFELIKDNEEKLTSLRRSLLEIDEMVSLKDEHINILQNEIDSIETDQSDYYKDSTVQELFKTLQTDVNNLEEYLDLKECALSQIKELENLVDSNKAMFDHFIKSNITDVLNKFNVKIVFLDQKNSKLLTEVKISEKKINQLSNYLQSSNQTKIDLQEKLNWLEIENAANEQLIQELKTENENLKNYGPKFATNDNSSRTLCKFIKTVTNQQQLADSKDTLVSFKTTNSLNKQFSEQTDLLAQQIEMIDKSSDLNLSKLIKNESNKSINLRQLSDITSQVLSTILNV